MPKCLRQTTNRIKKELSIIFIMFLCLYLEKKSQEMITVYRKTLVMKLNRTNTDLLNTKGVNFSHEAKDSLKSMNSFCTHANTTYIKYRFKYVTLIDIVLKNRNLLFIKRKLS